MKKPVTQIEAIKMAFASGIEMSNVNAFKLTGTMNLPQRVADLRKAGWVIDSRTAEAETQFGTSTEYSVYRLNKALTKEEIYKALEPEKSYKHFAPISGQQYLML